MKYLACRSFFFCILFSRSLGIFSQGLPHFHDTTIIDTAKKLAYVEGAHLSVIPFNIYNIKGKKIFRGDTIDRYFEVGGQQTQTEFDRCTIEYADLNMTVFHSLIIQDSSKLIRPHISFCTFDSLWLALANIKDASIDNCRILNIGYFSGADLRDTLILQDIDFGPSGRLSFAGAILPHFLELSGLKNIPFEIDLTTADFTNSQNDNKINIYLENSDISKLKLDYTHFKLWFADSAQTIKYHNYDETSDEDRTSIYEALINNFRSRGQLPSLENVDIEYRHYRAFRHWYTIPLFWIHYCWNRCGYSRSLVICWTISLFLIFSFWTSYKFRSLATKVYTMENVIDPYEMTKGQIRWYSLIYTANIFFRLTLKLENFTYEKKGW